MRSSPTRRWNTLRKRKRITNDRVPVGLFFGYIMAHGAHKLLYKGHLEYDRVFASPLFGAVSGPGVYQERGMGGTSGFQFCPHSVVSNGNILWHEIDHRTHLLKKAERRAHEAADTKRPRGQFSHPEGDDRRICDANSLWG